ncbi:putative dinucleotide-binding enzyme [Duganella sp. HSC-15S17]|uniref:Dinucleotide-binding enzyme n=1 Tax=Duganella violaceipulchra TaxID=2849652 RepID=A0ABT1GNN7_9BURK|nr:putative dinucleotide-binding enzyme [Duganella violaceicalia]
MSYAIIGFGKLGQALAKAFARSGIEVSVATTRAPESFASTAAAIGPGIIPKTLAEAVKAYVVFLAVCFESHRYVAKALPTSEGKTIVEVTNAYGVPLEELGMTAQRRRLLRLRETLVSRRSNWAGFRAVGCLCRRTETAGVS